MFASLALYVLSYLSTTQYLAFLLVYLLSIPPYSLPRAGAHHCWLLPANGHGANMLSHTKLLWTLCIFMTMSLTSLGPRPVNEFWLFLILAQYQKPECVVPMNYIQTDMGMKTKSCPLPSIYFYVNLVLNIERCQHFCCIQQKPVWILGLFYAETPLSSQ